MNLPNCPKCNSEYTYEDGALLYVPNVHMNGHHPSQLNLKI